MRELTLVYTLKHKFEITTITNQSNSNCIIYSVLRRGFYNFDNNLLSRLVLALVGSIQNDD